MRLSFSQYPFYVRRFCEQISQGPQRCAFHRWLWWISWGLTTGWDGWWLQWTDLSSGQPKSASHRPPGNVPLQPKISQDCDSKRYLRRIWTLNSAFDFICYPFKFQMVQQIWHYCAVACIALVPEPLQGNLSNIKLQSDKIVVQDYLFEILKCIFHHALIIWRAKMVKTNYIVLKGMR